MKRYHCNFCAEPYPLSQLDKHGACPNCQRFAPSKKPAGNQADDIMFRGQLDSPKRPAPVTVHPEPKLRNVSGNLVVDDREYEVVGQLTFIPLDD